MQVYIIHFVSKVGYLINHILMKSVLIILFKEWAGIK